MDMRHEAKLSVIKRAACHGNFKNICYTVAKRSLQALCYHLNCGKAFLARCIETSKASPEIIVANESEEFRAYIETNSCESVMQPTWIKLGPLHIKKFSYVYLGNGELYPIFGKVTGLYTLVTGSHRRYVAQIKICETEY